MAAAEVVAEEIVAPELIGSAPSSPAGSLEEGEASALPLPPEVPLPRLAQTLRFSQRQIQLVFRSRRELGEVFRMRGVVAGGPVVTSHPDHVRSLFTAKPEQAPSLTRESPLRPIVGPNSVLTAPAASTSKPTAPSPSAPQHRNVTMIPARGARVVVRARHE